MNINNAEFLFTITIRDTLPLDGNVPLYNIVTVFIAYTSSHRRWERARARRA